VLKKSDFSLMATTAEGWEWRLTHARNFGTLSLFVGDRAVGQVFHDIDRACYLPDRTGAQCLLPDSNLAFAHRETFEQAQALVEAAVHQWLEAAGLATPVPA